MFGTFLAQKLNKPYNGWQWGQLEIFISDVVSAIYTAKSPIKNKIFNVEVVNYSSKKIIKYLGGDYIKIPKRQSEPR